MNITPRAQLKDQTRELLQTAQVSPKTFTALYCGTTLLLDLLEYYVTAPEIAGIFVSIFTTLCSWVFAAGFAMYCMGIRRRERMEYATLFDGFAFTGKIILLNLLTSVLIGLWSMLFAIPGIIAAYRYSFALYNLYENPELDIMTALEMSKRQTRGYKARLFALDLSYLGWLLLATLPGMFLRAMTLTSIGFNVQTALSLPTPLWQLLFNGLWSALVGLFYVPNYQCVQLDYFDAAKADLAEADASFHREDSPDDPSGF